MRVLLGVSLTGYDGQSLKALGRLICVLVKAERIAMKALRKKNIKKRKKHEEKVGAKP